MTTIVIPGVIIFAWGPVNVGCSLPRPYCLLPILAAAILIGAGLSLMIMTNILFARVGQGTLAPWDPTRKFVAIGIYRRTRNPMITGVLCVLCGEAVLLGSFPLFIWFLVFAVGNIIYMPLVEEPGLERRFGKEYSEYKRHVPRWIPRWSPWEPQGGGK